MTLVQPMRFQHLLYLPARCPHPQPVIRGHPPNFAAIFPAGAVLFPQSAFQQQPPAALLRLSFPTVFPLMLSPKAQSHAQPCSPAKKPVFFPSLRIAQTLVLPDREIPNPYPSQLLLRPCRVLFRGAFPFPAARHAPVLLYQVSSPAYFLSRHPLFASRMLRRCLCRIPAGCFLQSENRRFSR